MNWQEIADNLGLNPDLTGRLEQLGNLERQVGGIGNTGIHPGGPAGESITTSRRPQAPERVR